MKDEAMTNAQNIVPKGSIRLRHAFDAVYRALTPEWEALIPPDELTEAGPDPRPLQRDALEEAEAVFRKALRDGELDSYVHNGRTGVDMHLDPTHWFKFGRGSGICSDYPSPEDPITPGPDCRLDNAPHPVFLDAGQLTAWLDALQTAGITASPTPTQHQIVSGESPNVSAVAGESAITVAEAARRSSLSKTAIYKAFKDLRLQKRKDGRRTLILVSDFDRFLREHSVS
jgi:hypothetical protein